MGLVWCEEKATAGAEKREKLKDNIVRFITNWSRLMLYELKMLRVSCPSSEVQQRIITNKMSILGCGRLYIFKKYQ